MVKFFVRSQLFNSSDYNDTFISFVFFSSWVCKGSLQKKNDPEMSKADNFSSDPPSLPIRLKCPPAPKNEHFFQIKKSRSGLGKAEK